VGAAPPVFPRIEFSLERIVRLQRPVLGAEAIVSVCRSADGLTNSVFRIDLADGPVLGLRLFAGGREPFENELRHLRHLAGAFPVPEVLVTEADSPEAPCPFIVYRWIEGVTLNELPAAPGEWRSGGPRRPSGAAAGGARAISAAAAHG
jgi:aminoglycoside phosphotransferase (APT) family kinase protein